MITQVNNKQIIIQKEYKYKHIIQLIIQKSQQQLTFSSFLFSNTARLIQTQKQTLHMNNKQDQFNKKLVILNQYVDKIMQMKQQKKYSVPNSNVFGIKKIDINYMEMFDLLIWIQKKKPQTLQSLLEMNILQISINLLHSDQMSSEVKSLILLINNCKINGEIIVYLLSKNLIDLIIAKYLKSIAQKKLRHKNQDLDQQLQYLGSLLKACNNHLNQKTYPYFLNKKIVLDQEKSKSVTDIKSKSQFSCDPDDIFNTCDISLSSFHKIEVEQKQCLLVKVCTRFYNCPQQLTKTSVLNILMSIIRQPFAKQLIFSKKTNKPHYYIAQWSRNLCRQFRNQLKNFNQQLMVLKRNQHDNFIQQINDRIILWEDLTHTQFKEIYRQNFMCEVLYSLIIGSLNTRSLPLFNIKFTFFILAKMMKICLNLDLLTDLGNLLFIKNKVKYCQDWVSTAVLKGFDIQKILNDSYYLDNSNQEQQINHFSGINQFFLNMLKSKDEHFLQISSHMLQQLMAIMKKDDKTKQYFIQNLGFGTNGRTLAMISSIFIGQLKFDHSLSNLQRICQTLIFIPPTKQLTQESANQFIYFYSQCLNQTLDLIQKGYKHLNYIIQTFQYDMRILEDMKFEARPLKDKYILIHPSQHQENIKNLIERQSFKEVFLQFNSINSKLNFALQNCEDFPLAQIQINVDLKALNLEQYINEICIKIKDLDSKTAQNWRPNTLSFKAKISSLPSDRTKDLNCLCHYLGRCKLDYWIRLGKSCQNNNQCQTKAHLA